MRKIGNTWNFALLCVAIVFSLAYFLPMKEASAASKLPTPTWKTATFTGTTINLSWNKVGLADGYRLYYKKSTSKTYSSKITHQTSCKVSGTAGATYNFYLIAQPLTRANKASSCSKILTVTVPTKTVALSVPSSISVYGGYKKILVSWSTVKNASAYAIQYRKKGTSTWTTCYVESKGSAIVAASYVISGLSNNVSYQVRVSARASKGSGFTHSAYSSSITKKTLSKNPSYFYIPTTFVDYNIRRDSYRINW